MLPSLDDDLESASSAASGDTRPHSIVEGTELRSGNVTEWTIWHHFPNLIEELTAPKESNFAFLSRSLHQQLLNIADKHTQTLSEDVTEPPPIQTRPRFRINLAEQQRMRIRQLQCELVKDVVHMRHSRTDSRG